MNRNSFEINKMVFMILLATGIIVGLLAGVNFSSAEWRADAVKHGVAHYVLDTNTLRVDFVWNK